jgi:(1->4)-alpha-D-glucan 1-alpha-D-glucosylmutase
LSLVDPDNRRPVDHGLRERLLDGIEAAVRRDGRRAAMLAMLDDWRDGRAKLALVAALLAHRRERPALYAEGGYEALAATGPKADRVFAFARVRGEEVAVVVAGRFPARHEADPGWDGTGVPWPEAAASAPRRWRDVLTDRVLERRGDRALPAEAVLADLPIAVLVPDAWGHA